MNPATLLGIGSACPPYFISQSNSVAVARWFVHEPDESTKVLPALYRMTRVKRRASVLLEAPSEECVHQSFYHQAAHAEDHGPTTSRRMQQFALGSEELAAQSATAALEDAQLPASAITHLVTISCTGFEAPGFDIALFEQLGLDLEVQRIQVGFMGCHGLINGIRVAKAIAASDPSARILVVSVELCSLHYQYGWDTDRVVANALFADGSGALVIGCADQPRNPSQLKIIATGSRLIPNSREAMTWKIGDNGFQMTLASSVPHLIEENLHGYLTAWLAKHALSITDIAHWAVHPGGPRVLGSVENALQLPSDALDTSRNILAHFGNMSSATLAFIVQESLRHSAPSPGPCLMMGFGPGLEIELALLSP